MLKRITAVMLVAAISFFVFGCGAKEETDVTTIKEFLYDTYIELTVYDECDDKVLGEIRDYLVSFENVFSPTREGSQLYMINHSADTEIKISRDIYNVIEASLPYCELTDGVFDITIRPVTALYDFESKDFPPAPEAINAALEKVDYKGVSVYENNGEYYLHKNNKDIMIDLGAVAKGYISGEAAKYLRQKGINHALLNFGGNVVCVGNKITDGVESDFRIEVFNPVEGDESHIVVNATDKSVIVSGTYQRYTIYNGKKYHHIIDANTGKPVDTQLLGVAVICDDPLKGDIVSTTAFLAKALGKDIAFEPDVAIQYIYSDGTKEYTGNFEQFLE